MKINNKTVIAMLCALCTFGSLTAQQKTEDLTRYVNPLIGTQEMGHVFPEPQCLLAWCNLVRTQTPFHTPVLTENIPEQRIVTAPDTNIKTPLLLDSAIPISAARDTPTWETF